MILTGAAGADEALAMGLANRVVPNGQAREAAEELGADLAACRRSACGPTGSPSSTSGA